MKLTRNEIINHLGKEKVEQLERDHLSVNYWREFPTGEKYERYIAAHKIWCEFVELCSAKNLTEKEFFDSVLEFNAPKGHLADVAFDCIS